MAEIREKSRERQTETVTRTILTHSTPPTARKSKAKSRRGQTQDEKSGKEGCDMEEQQ